MKIDRSNMISIQKRVFLNKAELSISIKSKKIGFIEMKKDNNGWKVESFYFDRTYDKNGKFVNRLYESVANLSMREELESIDDSLISILKYMEKDWQKLNFIVRLTSNLITKGDWIKMIREINQEVILDKNSFWEEEILVSELEKSKKSFIRFSLCKKDNKEFVSIREFVSKGEEDIPTKKGMTISREYLKDFIECLNKI